MLIVRFLKFLFESDFRIQGSKFDLRWFMADIFELRRHSQHHHRRRRSHSHFPRPVFVPAEANILMEVFYKDKKIQVMKLEGSNGLEGPSGAMIHQAQEVLVTGFFGILKKGMIVNPRRIYRGAVNPFLFRHCPSKLFWKCAIWNINIHFGPWQTLSVLRPSFCAVRPSFCVVRPSFCLVWPAFVAIWMTFCISNTNFLKFF